MNQDNNKNRSKFWEASSKEGFLTRRKMAVLLSGILILITTGIAGYLLINQQSSKNAEYDLEKGALVFTIDDKGYYESEIKPMVGYITDSFKKDNKEALDSLVDLYKYKAVAGKLGFSPSQEAIDSQKEVLIKNTYMNDVDKKGFGEWINLVAFKEAIAVNFSMQSADDDNSFKGYSFIFWFGNRIARSDDYIPPGGYDNLELLNSDKEYAKQKAEYYHKQLTDKKMTLDEVLEAVSSDPKIGLLYTTDKPLSKKFGYNIASLWQDQVGYEDVSSFIKSHPQKGLSAIQTGKIDSSLSGESSDMIDAFYYFVDIDGENVSKGTFDATLNSLKIVKRY